VTAGPPPPAPDRLSTGRVPTLDGLRGVAIALVFLHHTSVVVGPWNTARTEFDRVCAMLGFAGWCGVDLFFVLSGYLITGVLLDARGRPHYFRNFYARRALRIFPLYYGVLTLVALAAASGLVRGPDSFLWYWAYLENWLYVANGAFSSTLAHFWSLAVEEQFYLFWPALLYWTPRRWLLGAVAVAIPLALVARTALSLAIRDDSARTVATYVATPCRIDALALGGALAVALRSERWRDVVRRAAAPVFLGSGAAIAAVFLLRGGLAIRDPWVHTVGFSLLAFFFGALLVLAVSSPRDSRTARALSLRPLRWIGVVSYGIYVVHWIVLQRFGDAFRLPPEVPFLFRHLATAAVFAVPVLLLAAASWYAFERPILRWKSRFETR
jgi:peptidoglycan/LPS O-acetylase OafA/YrhL